ncbi:PEP-CTERM sorting domain-containing protein [Roseateles cellulosilyticus]|uniref:PEP-CTERM sorting domain-containing protein n=1 Tax=Pelomonas cellulosilytica TaxID=2906762 RepID=A0ABS8Y275_9BURK|nr:PEP-CTERM sorting domain-containing protein [Pelomonas sp. P8]MCE4557176.1 PEP-CTERM sorting domain-containing protein [Pelomonas sp. P8]
MFKPLALAAALLVSAPVFAGSIQIKYQGKDADAVSLSTTVTTNYGTAGLSFLDSVSGSFLAYSLEPTQQIALKSKGDKTYAVDSFTGSQATLLQGLYSSSFASVNSAKQQAAFQLAIWEIATETSGTLSITEGSGSFYLKTSGQPASLNAVQALATNYLKAAQTYSGSELYSLTKLTNPTYQDLIVASALPVVTPNIGTSLPVPEPETYALFLGGLGVIGLLARRRLPR